MKAIGLGIILFFSIGAQAQVKDSVRVNTYLKVTEFSRDSLGFDITIVLVNNKSSAYYYPKSLEQTQEGNVLTETFNFSLVPHKLIDLSGKIISTGYNSYDTLVEIGPGDSLIIKYNKVNVSRFKKSDRVVYIKNYIIGNPQAVKQTKEGNSYVDRYNCSVKKIEYKLICNKKGHAAKVSINSNCSNSSSRVY